MKVKLVRFGRLSFEEDENCFCLDESVFFGYLPVTVSDEKGENEETLSLAVATPDGLEYLAEQGKGTSRVLFAGTLLVVQEYEHQTILAWVRRVLSSCEKETWRDCLQSLHRYFSSGRGRGDDPDGRRRRGNGLTVGRILTGSDLSELRRWKPDSVSGIDTTIGIFIDGLDGVFTARLITPAQIQELESNDGIRLAGHVIIMGSYDFHSLLAWIEQTVRSCTMQTVEESVAELGRYFDYDEFW